MKASELKKRILAAKDTKLSGPHTVPEWDGLAVWLKTLSGTERDEFEEGYSNDKSKALRARFLVKCLCDSDGERLFADAEVEELGKRNNIVLTRLFDLGWDFNKFSQKAADELGKDSPSSDPSAAST